MFLYFSENDSYMSSKKEMVTVLTVKTENSQNTIKSLKEEIKLLKQALESAEIGSEDFLNTQKQLKSIENELKTAIKGQSEAVDAAEGSYNHLTQTMAGLKKEWKATADEIKRNEIGQQIEEINNQLKELDAGIGNYQRNVGNYANDFKTAMQEQADSTAEVRTKLDALQKTANGLASGYAALQGTMALLNIENEQFEETMIKVQSAMAIAQGVGGMKDLIEGAGTLIVSFKGAAVGCKAFITSLKGVKAAIAATGIGILVVLLGELYANWDKITKFFKDTFAIENTTDKMNNLKKAIEDNNEKLEQLNNEALKDYLEKIRTAKGDNEKLKNIEDELTETNLKNALAIAQQNEQNARKLQLYAGLALADDNSKKNLEKLQEATNALTDAENKRLTAEIALEKFQQNKNSGSSGSGSDSNNRKSDAESIAERVRQAGIDTYEEKIAEEIRIYEEEKALLEQYHFDTEELTRQHKERLKAIEEEYEYLNKPQTEGLLSQLSQTNQIKVDLFKSASEQIKNIDDKTLTAIKNNINEQRKADVLAEKEKVERKKFTAQASLQIASSVAGSLASILGEETKAGKAAAVAQATIDTYQAANSAYSSMAGIPVVGPALGAAAAAAAVIAGIANVKKILTVSDNPNNSSMGSMGSINNPSSPAVSPRINLADTLPVQYSRNLLTDSETANLNKEQTVVVLESDISETQKRVKVKELNASF